MQIDSVAVRPDDTEDALATRVLAMEHRLYPRAVRWWVDGLLDHTDDGRILVRTGESQLLMDTDPDNPVDAP